MKLEMLMAYFSLGLFFGIIGYMWALIDTTKKWGFNLESVFVNMLVFIAVFLAWPLATVGVIIWKTGVWLGMGRDDRR